MGNACSKKSSVDEGKGRADAASNVLPHIENSVAGDNPSRFTAYNNRFTAYNPQAQYFEELILLHQNLADTGQPNIRKPIRASLDIGGQLCNMSDSNPKSEEIRDFLLMALDDHFAFNSIGNETKMKLVDAMEEERVNEGEWVMHQVSSSHVLTRLDDQRSSLIFVLTGGDWGLLLRHSRRFRRLLHRSRPPTWFYRLPLWMSAPHGITHFLWKSRDSFRRACGIVQ